MADQSFTSWQNRDYPAGDAPFRAAEVGGPRPFFHDELDQRRASWRSTPEAQYPDGYLGTINPRRSDRLLQGLKQRTTAKPYSRGIHKGERRDPSDYMWPEEFNLFSGLEAEARGEKFSVPGLQFELGEVLTNDGKPNANFMPTIKGLPARDGVVEWNDDNPDRQAHLRRLAPPWSGKRGPDVVGRNPGMAVPYPGR